MIIKFNDFLNESIRDKMIGVLKPDQIEDIVSDDTLDTFISIYKSFKDMNEMDIEILNKIEEELLFKDEWEKLPKEKRKEVIDDIFSTGFGSLILRYDLLTQDQINNTIWEDDLNTALYNLQTEIGVTSGDVASVAFSGIEEEDWENADYEQRKIWIDNYLDTERHYLDF